MNWILSGSKRYKKLIFFKKLFFQNGKYKKQHFWLKTKAITQERAKKTYKSICNSIAKINKESIKKINEIMKIRVQLETGKVERKLPGIILNSIETVYQTPLRILDKFGEKQLKKSERYVVKYLRRQ